MADVRIASRGPRAWELNIHKLQDNTGDAEREQKRRGRWETKEFCLEKQREEHD